MSEIPKQLFDSLPWNLAQSGPKQLTDLHFYASFVSNIKYCSLVSGPTNAPLVRVVLCKEQEKPDRRRVEWLTHWIFLKGTNVCVVNDFSVCDFSYVSQKNEWKSFSKPNHVVLVPKPNQTGNINDSTKVIIWGNMSTPCQQSSFWNWSRCCIQCITAYLSVKPFKCKNCHLISEA